MMGRVKTVVKYYIRYAERDHVSHTFRAENALLDLIAVQHFK